MSVGVTVIKINKPRFRTKLASFDYDNTIVEPKDGRPFSKDINDWQWTYENVPSIILQYYNNGYMIAVFTNQSKDWKITQIKNVLEKLNIPMFVVIATEKSLYKPNTMMFNVFIEYNKLNKEKSFFIGDALGRKGDFSDSDKLFGENIGIKVMSPESVFKSKDNENVIFKFPDIPICDEKEIIIMVGMPASGKTSCAVKIFKPRSYIIIHGDVYKTSTKMIKFAKEHKDKSIVFDATNGTKIKRKEYIDFGKENGYKIRCIQVTTSFEDCIKRNKERDENTKIPLIVYNIYKKNFEEPSEDEGVTIFKI